MVSCYEDMAACSANHATANAVQITPQQMQCKSRHSKCRANHATANAVQITPQQMQWKSRHSKCSTSAQNPASSKLYTHRQQTGIYNMYKWSQLSRT